MNSAKGAQAPLTGAMLGITAVALALGTFMQVLDGTIANVSLTTIAGNLGVSADTSTWVITAFAVANGVTVPLTGWLMGRYGVVRTFVTSVALFTIASLLCGIAWNLSSLVLFRVIQGAVSGPMIPGSQALLIAIFPPTKRATALGIWSMTTLVAPIMGPLLGGYISDNYHWSWIFLINVPVGIAAGAVSWFSLRKRDTPTRRLPIDKVGMTLLAFWVGSLQIMLDLGKNADWFASPFIVVMTLCAIVGFCAWLIWELTDAHPVVDLTLFRNRNFLFGTIALSLGYALFFANALLLPLWLQQQLGYTATWAGLVSAPSGMAAVLTTIVVSRFAGKVDARIMATIAFGGFALSYFMRSGFTTYADFWHLMTPLLFQGMAMGMFFMAMLNISLDGIPPERMPSATGISNFARITAGSFAASVVVTLWDRREAVHQSHLSEISGPASLPFGDAVARLGSLGLTDTQAAAMISRQMVGQAYLLASTDIFWASAWLSMMLGMIVWLARRPKPLQGPVAAD
ncbi:DHA2 family efflux MFS transporter permease subunit [soil metagenome]